MHTEEQARGLWCPMKWGPDKGNARYTGGECIGSKCAMWRWELESGPGARPQPPLIASDHGYCGLADSQGLKIK